MKLNLLQDILIQRIQEFGMLARDHRQVYKRLEQLLPDRLKALTDSRRRSGASASSSLREALVSKEYEEMIQEVVEMGHKSFYSRIQYETHMMLLDARRSRGAR